MMRFLALLLVLTASCGSVQRFYEGTPRPRAEVARIDGYNYLEDWVLGREGVPGKDDKLTVRVVAVDGVLASTSTIEVLPGSHTLRLAWERIEVRLPLLYGGAEYGRGDGEMTLHVHVEASKSYVLGIQAGEAGPPVVTLVED